MSGKLSKEVPPFSQLTIILGEDKKDTSVKSIMIFLEYETKSLLR